MILGQLSKSVTYKESAQYLFTRHEGHGNTKRSHQTLAKRHEIGDLLPGNTKQAQTARLTDLRHEFGHSPAVGASLSPEHKAVLVALTVRQHEVWSEELHHVAGRARHQLQGGRVVWLGEAVVGGEPVEALSVDAHHYPRVEQAAVVLLEVPHVLVLRLGHEEVDV